MTAADDPFREKMRAQLGEANTVSIDNAGMGRKLLALVTQSYWQSPCFCGVGKE